MHDVIIDLEQIKQLAAQHHDEFEVMRYMLEADDDLDDGMLDAFVNEIAAPIVAAIDCTQCANCCRSLEVQLTPADIEQVAEAVQIPVSDVMARYVEPADEHGGTFRARPCAFLANNRCSIYAQRPDACRIYPLFTPDFRWTLAHTIAGAGLCPIIYNVLIAVHKLEDEIFKL